jgi:hypothetical protein
MEKRFRVCFDVLVKAYFAFGIEDTDVHLFGMKIDSTIVFVLLGVKSHMASSFGLKCFLSKRHFTMPQEEALNIIKLIKATGDSPSLFAEALARAPYF